MKEENQESWDEVVKTNLKMLHLMKDITLECDKWRLRVNANQNSVTHNKPYKLELL